MPPNTKPAWVWMLALPLALISPALDRVAAAEFKTSKERLSDKAADDQRVDNCRVPVDRRGSVPRPDCTGGAEVRPSATPGNARHNGVGPNRP